MKKLSSWTSIAVNSSFIYHRVSLNLKKRAIGQGMVEYALILVLIAVVVVAVLTILGHSASDTLSSVNNKLPS